MVFEPYVGYRWQIPSGIKVKKSIQDKFTKLETYFPCIIIHKLKYLINGTLNTFNTLPFSVKIDPVTGFVNSWIPPANLSESIKTYKMRDVHEWKVVKMIYLKLFKVRRFLKSLIHRWQITKCIKNVKNLDDPVTLEIPKCVIQVLDFPRKLSYIFEASSLIKTMELRITLSDYMFPNPLKPMNPFTNEVFTRGQLLSIINQSKKHGKFSWILDRLYASECNMDLFTNRFRQPLKIMAIENHFKGPVSRCMDEVVDFFKIEADRDELPYDKVLLFEKRIVSRQSCSFIREWVNLTRDFYIARELHDIKMIDAISIKTTSMIARAYYVLS